MATYTYQVQRSPDGSTWTDVSGATGSFSGISPFTHDIPYLIQSGDVGDYIRCKVTDSFGNITYSGLVGPATATSPPPPVPSGSYRPFISASAFNTPIISNPPIHPGSSLMISAANNWLLGGTANDAHKEWLGPFSSGNGRTAYHRGDTSKLPTITMYANNNGWVGAGPFTMPMPTGMAASLAPYCATGDANLTIVDSVTGNVWETWHTTPPSEPPRDSGHSGAWNCSAYRHWSGLTSGLGYATSGFSSSFNPGTSGSRIPLVTGLLIPEDFADCWSGDPGTAIPHMTRMDTFCGSNGANYPIFVKPAAGGDGQQAHGIPAGARGQLDPSINVSTWPSVNALNEPYRSAMKKILRGHQQYGITQVDSYGAAGNGSIDCPGTVSLDIGGNTYAINYQWPWEAAGYGGKPPGVPYDLMSHYRIIDWTKWAGV